MVSPRERELRDWGVGEVSISRRFSTARTPSTLSAIEAAADFSDSEPTVPRRITFPERASTRMAR